MFKQLIKSGLVLFGLLFITQGIASTFTGGDLYHACKKRQGAELRGLCVGYIAGVVEGDKYWSGKKRQVCIRKKRIRYKKFRRLMRNWLDRNRHMHSKPGYQVVLLALKAAYPCN
jgi:hypothetical protein